jgi:hypothetical protein
MRPLPVFSLAVLSLALSHSAVADDIAVSPGKDVVAAALAKAKAGDTVKLAAGEYTESVVLLGDVTLQGAGADKTTITGVKGVTINCQGPHNRITDLTVKGSAEPLRGVNTSTPVRIERCRFVKIPEAVAMMGAPLSDVVACEFVDCGIGVRAIGEASPTVWGCSFKGGNIGVFCMHGSPYIRDNAFVGVKSGVRTLPHDSEPGIIRNNAFIDCTDGAVVVLSSPDIFSGPSIRNNVVSNCSAAVIAPASLTRGVTHNLFNMNAGQAFRDDKGAAVTAPDNIEGDAGVAVSDALSVKVAHPELVNGKGIRHSWENPGTAGTIGLEKEWLQLGIGAAGTLPPARFGGKRLIANSVAEEYQYLQLTGRKMGRQSMGKDGGVSVDRMTPGDGKKPEELVFDISRFFSESGLKP